MALAPAQETHALGVGGERNEFADSVVEALVKHSGDSGKAFSRRESRRLRRVFRNSDWQMQQGKAVFRSDSSSEWTLHKIWPPLTLNTQPSIINPQPSTLSNPQQSAPNLNVQHNLQRELTAEFVRVDRNPLQLEAQAAADGRVGGQAREGEASAESSASAAAPHAKLKQPSPVEHGGDDLDKGTELFIQFLASANRVMCRTSDDDDLLIVLAETTNSLPLYPHLGTPSRDIPSLPSYAGPKHCYKSAVSMVLHALTDAWTEHESSLHKIRRQPNQKKPNLRFTRGQWQQHVSRRSTHSSRCPLSLSHNDATLRLRPSVRHVRH